MKEYSKPVIDVVSEAAEGVYAASGNVTQAVRCGSEYMRGIWQGQDSSSWWINGVEYPRSYKDQFGCHGCRAFTGTGCAYASGNHYNQSGNAESYESDSLEDLKPIWEQKGYGPDDTVSDFNC